MKMKKKSKLTIKMYIGKSDDKIRKEYKTLDAKEIIS